MTTVYSEDTQKSDPLEANSEELRRRVPRRKFVRVMQSIGAILITLFALWFLFGVPAYLLFGIFFQ